ncbi:MAG: UDP-3-O-acyl-N-acetylglucosamine deacetylase [Fimbriimonadaceae bacterium]|nr:MAG: UDP-3-O-acyl-N-acetylglucosamine deacetylase [Fimbriimonadaceae bacterium]
MERSYPRRTLSGEFTIEAPGLHSGEPTSVRVVGADQGIRFSDGSTWVTASPHAVTDTSRCTKLGTISTVEHLMSAFAALGVTDADVIVTGGELPVAGGCSLPFVEAILSAGITECGVLTVKGPFARIYLQERPSKFAIGLGEGWWRAVYVRENEFVGHQEFEIALTPESYVAQVAPARTFVLEYEIEMAKKYGLGKGLDESSCLGVGPTKYLNDARFPDEPVRHKLLDVIGDLYLTGVPIQHLDVVAEFTGHALNVAAAQKLADSVEIIRS